MNNHSVKAYVTQADGGYVRLKLLDTELKNTLLDLGFSQETNVGEYKISSSDDTIKANIFAKLRTLDICFAHGREWCPAEVFKHLRDIGVLSGGFRVIIWTDPGRYVVRDEK